MWPAGIDPELPAENYFKRVNSIPLLSRAEEAELIERWKRFRDAKARERIIESHLRMPPAIARRAVRDREPSEYVLSTDVLVDAWSGHREMIEDLAAEGNLALLKAFDQFNPAKGFAFATYARRCIWNAVRRRLRSFASSVDRPWGKPVPTDIYIEPGRPEPQPFWEYCGGQARIATPSDDDERKDGERLPDKYQRLRRFDPEPDTRQV